MMCFGERGAGGALTVQLWRKGKEMQLFPVHNHVLMTSAYFGMMVSICILLCTLSRCRTWLWVYMCTGVCVWNSEKHLSTKPVTVLFKVVKHYQCICRKLHSSTSLPVIQGWLYKEDLNVLPIKQEEKSALQVSHLPSSNATLALMPTSSTSHSNTQSHCQWSLPGDRWLIPLIRHLDDTWSTGLKWLLPELITGKKEKEAC